MVISFSSNIDSVISKVTAALEDERTIGQSVTDTVRQHLKQRFPSSTHWSPNKVRPIQNGARVDIPGASRAYHDVTIVPKKANSLAIPLASAAKGRSPRMFQNLFVLKAKSGNAFLAKSSGSGVQLFYLLRKKVNQRQDSSLMPSDDTIAESLLKRIS